MQIVNVLRDKGEGPAALGERAFEPGEREMRLIGLAFRRLRRRRS